MLHLRTFGALSVADDGAPVTGAGQQRKTLGLLAFLAAAGSGGASRDKLIACLWPETDAEHGRGLLRQACYALRRDLHAPELFLGSIQLRLNPAAISSDVGSFLGALERNDPATAISLYRGPFLDGFYLNGGGEFESWAETERARLASRCRSALEVLAASAAEGAQHRAAADYWRRLLELDPLSSHAALSLVAALDRAGERAEALRTAEAYGDRVRSELGANSPPELSQWVEQHRHPSHDAGLGPRPLAAPVPTNGTMQPPLPKPPLTRQAVTPRRRNGRLALLALLVAGLAVVWQVRHSTTAPAGPSSTIAVLPFSYRGTPEFAYLGEGMVDLLAANLNGAGDIRTVDPHAILVRARQSGVTWNSERARAVADQLRAGSYVLGDVIEVGGRLHISARLHHLGTQDNPAYAASVEGAASQLFRLVDALTIQLLRTRGRDPQLPVVNLAALTTDSLSAIKAYLEGERALRTSQADSAIDAFQRAARIDSSFALAHYRLAVVAGPGPVGRKALDQAMRYSTRLGDHGRKLIQALDAFYGGQQKEAERLYRQIVTSYPHDFEAWTQWGEVIFHGGSRIDNSWFDAREAFERALAMEPRDANLLWHLSNLAARQRRLAELESLTERLIRTNPHPSRVLMARGQRAIVLGDTAGVERFASEARKASDEFAQPAIGFLTFTTGDLGFGRRLWREIADPSRPRGMRVLAYKTLAQIELMSGRWAAARSQLDTMGILDPATALEHRALFALWPLQRVSRDELLALRDSLLAWKAAPGPTNETSILAELSPAHPYLRLYLLGLLAARLGESSAALRYAGELKERSSGAFAPEFVADLGVTVRAEVDRLGGQPRVALQTLDQASFWNRVEVPTTGLAPFFVREYERYLRAELLNAVGRTDEALKSYVQMADNLFHLGAPAHYRLAQIYDRRGDRQKAIRGRGRRR